MRCGLIEVKGKAFIIFRISLPPLPPSPVIVQTFDGTWPSHRFSALQSFRL